MTFDKTVRVMEAGRESAKICSVSNILLLITQLSEIEYNEFMTPVLKYFFDHASRFLRISCVLNQLIR